MSNDPRKVAIAIVDDSEALQKYAISELEAEECITCKRVIHMTKVQILAHFKDAVEDGFEFVMFQCSECYAKKLGMKRAAEWN
jgi:hypothetical protein